MGRGGVRMWDVGGCGRCIESVEVRGGQVCEYDTIPLLLLLWLQTRVEIVRTGGVRV